MAEDALSWLGEYGFVARIPILSHRRSTASGLVAALVIVVATLAWPGATSARPRYRDRIEQARLLFLEGKADLHVGDFVGAIARFKESYALSARPLLLFNIAVAASSAMQPELAREYFEKFLVAAEAKAPERAEAEAALRNLDKVIAQQRLLNGPAKVAAQPPPPKPAPAPIAAPQAPAPAPSVAATPVALQPTPRLQPPPSPPQLEESAPSAALIAAAPPPPRSRRSLGLIVGLTLGGVALVGGAIALGLVFGLGPSYPAATGQAHLH
jgi:hypothetical protein